MIDSTIDFANIQSKKLLHAAILNVIIKKYNVNHAIKVPNESVKFELIRIECEFESNII